MSIEYKYTTKNPLSKNKEKYPLLYDFLSSKNYDISNVFVAETPVIMLVWVDEEKGELYNKHVSLEPTEEQEYSKIINKKYQIFIYAEEEMRLLLKDIRPISTYKYSDNLRMFYEKTPWWIEQELRLKKLERILDDN